MECFCPVWVAPTLHRKHWFKYDSVFYNRSNWRLPISSDAPYIVAISPAGLIVGSAPFASDDLIGGQQSLSVWADDTGTPELDGALAGDAITFQLVDGNSLYDLNLTFGGVNSFVANGTLPVFTVSAELTCSPHPSCDLPQPYSGETGVNMTCFLLLEQLTLFQYLQMHLT